MCEVNKPHIHAQNLGRTSYSKNINPMIDLKIIIVTQKCAI